MTTIRRKLAAVPFAHLLGFSAEDDDGAKKGKRAKSAEDDDKDKDASRAGDAPDDDKDSDASRAEDGDDEDGDEKDKSKSRKAKSKSKAEDGDGEEEDDEQAEGDDSDEEMRGNSAVASARRRERARCKAIFACAAAGVRPDVAATLAFTTTMTRKEAIEVLTSTAAVATGMTSSTESRPSGSRGALDRRMAALDVPQVGADGGADAPAGMSKVAAAIVAAGEKARGK